MHCTKTRGGGDRIKFIISFFRLADLLIERKRHVPLFSNAEERSHIHTNSRKTGQIDTKSNEPNTFR